MKQLTEFELEIIHAVVVLQELHDKPELSASVLKEWALLQIVGGDKLIIPFC
ncbi:hypothetical protein ABZZ68_19355 [Proteus mirabilis]|nr:hypothetical protein [Proteus mirabilis]